jgi:hypothetical protein
LPAGLKATVSLTQELGPERYDRPLADMQYIGRTSYSLEQAVMRRTAVGPNAKSSDACCIPAAHISPASSASSTPRGLTDNPYTRVVSAQGHELALSVATKSCVGRSPSRALVNHVHDLVIVVDEKPHLLHEARAPAAKALVMLTEH